MPFKVSALLTTLMRFNVQVGYRMWEFRAPNFGSGAISLEGFLPATRVFILKSPALSWPTPCGTSRYTLVDECHARRVRAYFVPFRTRGRTPQEMDIANYLKAKGSAMVVARDRCILLSSFPSLSVGMHYLCSTCMISSTECL